MNNKIESRLLIAAGVFLTINTLSLVLTRSEVRALLWLVLWIGCASAGHLALRRIPRRDPVLFPIAMFLSGWGLVLIGRLAPEFSPRQPIWLVVAVLSLILVVGVRGDLRWLRDPRWLLLGFVLLGLTVISGQNPSGFGPRLWLGLSGIGLFDAWFQPSEALKVILIAFLAAQFTAADRTLQRYGLIIGAWAICIAVFIFQRDFGAAALLYLVLMTLLAVYTPRYTGWIVVGGLALLLMAGLIAYDRSDVVRTRVDIWVNPFLDPNDRSFQIVQSLLAFSSGGLFGQGLGQGSPTYVPVTHSDFVLAAVGEEYGLFGTLAVIGLFGVLITRGLRIARRLYSDEEHRFGAILATGLSVMLAMQTIMIAGGVIKLIPLTGVTLSLMSYGGSSLLISLIIVGLLLRLSDTSADVPAGVPTHVQRVRTETHIQSSIPRLFQVGLTLVALMIAWWSLPPNSTALAAREFNPRLVEQERAIWRGAIYDRYGVLLAETVQVDTSRSRQPVTIRRYARIETAAALGYYSLRYGLGGIERAYDAELRGELSPINALIHAPRRGQSLQLTLDADLQRRILRAFGTGRGAAVVMDAQSGAIRALVSAPSFNPNALDAQYLTLLSNPGAPLFNRALSASYQPGTIIRPFVWAGLAESGIVDRSMSAITTEQRDVILTMMQQAGLFAPESLVRYPAAVVLPIPTQLTTDDLNGQGALTVTPLTMAAIMAAIANDGSPVVPYLIEGLTDEQTVSVPVQRTFSPTAIRAIRAGMTPVLNGYYLTGSAQVGQGQIAWIIGAINHGGESLVIAAVAESGDADQVERLLGVFE